MPISTAVRMDNVHRSYVREILKVAGRPGVISFAGGLPSPRFIPARQIAEAIRDILANQGAACLQYCASEGHMPLRQWIAEQYGLAGLRVSADQILITTGSQQGLDLIAKVLLDPGDSIIVEDPTYTAALQAFGIFQPRFRPIPLDEDGIDARQLRRDLNQGAKLLYCMPDFQNPTGISYSASRRIEVAQCLRETDTVIVEDDPYGRLRFSGDPLPPIAARLPGRSILLGSFSKIIAPGLRLGWVCAPMELMEKLIIAKQAADLHSENLGQWVVHRLVTSGHFDEHLQQIRSAYRRQCEAMIEAIGQFLPGDVTCTHPQGGMFLWLSLGRGVSSRELFDIAITRGVAFVPGPAFYANGGGEESLRLNFSNCDEAQIVLGIRRLAEAIDEMCAVGPTGISMPSAPIWRHGAD